MTAEKPTSQLENPNVPTKRGWPDLTFLVIFTVIFAASAVSGAMRKSPWIDEIVTVRLAALPFGHLWNALRAGADSAPPLSHILVGAFAAMFGPTNVAIRVPSIAGYLIMSVCLFVFVRRWAGTGIAAAAVLMIACTPALTAAIEARAYALLLGTSTLSILCWQHAAANKARLPWLIGLALSTAASASLHYYTPILYLPLVFAEASRNIRLKKIDWPVWVAFVGGISVMFVYLPLLRGLAAQSLPNSESKTYWAAATVSSLHWAVQDLFSPLLIPVTCVVVIIAVALRRRAPSDSTADEPLEYLVLASGLLLLPYLLFVVCRMANGAFSSRYLLSTELGWAILLALILRRLPARSWVIAGTLLVLSTVVVTHLRFLSAGSMVTVQTVDRALQSPATRDLPIVIANANAFAAFMYNAPVTMRGRVYYVKSFTGEPIPGKDSTAERVLLAFARWSPLPNIVDLGDLERQNKEFFVYQEGPPSFQAVIPNLLRAGADVGLDRNLPDSFVRVRVGDVPGRQTAGTVAGGRP